MSEGNGSRRPGDTDQDASDSDQTAADREQTASEADQTASDIDQAQSDSDQLAAARDQAAADRDVAAHPDRKDSYERTRAEREKSAAERDAVTFARTQSTRERDDAAAIRDEMARLRDEAAVARDKDAEKRDLELRAQAEISGPLDKRLNAALDAAEAARREARKARVRAAADRERAATDRERAADDRARAAIELGRAHLDDLTGAYRRELGVVAIGHEIERAKRSKRSLVLAYIDIDGLKRRNDEGGHAAGDELLRSVAGAIRASLRPYDPIVRLGGDEFVCTFSNGDLAGAEDRFEHVRSLLEKTDAAASISIGFAEMRSDETAEDLIKRGDAAMYAAKRAQSAL
jgi:diguanylate cyclase (GGDEF)-like protein